MATTNRKTALGAGALAAAAAAAAAGYYFYASPNAKKNRRIAASWTAGLKREVVKQAKSVQKMDRKQMLSVIDKAVRAYGAARSLDRRELARAAKELRDNWQKLSLEVRPVKAVARKTAARKTAAKRSKRARRA
ncbi:MAG: hypothetical protein JO019_05140 [Candidatus Kaiserbacteria bacterium]|nr:hypothetical protein [Candidatus Kaiserbacteria bacterium]